MINVFYVFNDNKMQPPSIRDTWSGCAYDCNNGAKVPPCCTLVNGKPVINPKDGRYGWDPDYYTGVSYAWCEVDQYLKEGELSSWSKPAHKSDGTCYPVMDMPPESKQFPFVNIYRTYTYPDPHGGKILSGPIALVVMHKDPTNPITDNTPLTLDFDLGGKYSQDPYDNTWAVRLGEFGLAMIVIACVIAFVFFLYIMYSLGKGQ
jgi:hypothetical protein